MARYGFSSLRHRPPRTGHTPMVPPASSRCAVPCATPVAEVRRESPPQLPQNPRAHAEEHSLEVEVPFLQQQLGEFTLVPLVVGEADPEETAAVLDQLWDGPDTTVVISSDLSHYLPYQDAQRADAATAKEI